MKSGLRMTPKSMCVIWFEKSGEASGGEAVRGIMSTSVVRIGIAGCGLAARIHLDRLLALENVEVIGCADPNLPSALALADHVSVRGSSGASRTPLAAYSDHRELLRQQTPD